MFPNMLGESTPDCKKWVPFGLLLHCHQLLSHHASWSHQTWYQLEAGCGCSYQESSLWRNIFACNFVSFSCQEDPVLNISNLRDLHLGYSCFLHLASCWGQTSRARRMAGKASPTEVRPSCQRLLWMNNIAQSLLKIVNANFTPFHQPNLSPMWQVLLSSLEVLNRWTPGSYKRNVGSDVHPCKFSHLRLRQEVVWEVSVMTSS